MKLCLFVLASLVAMCFSANIHMLIRHEVHALLAADTDLTADHCTTKCDALFDLIAGHDEAATDKMCAYECDCQINHTCQQHHTHAHTTTRPHQPNVAN